MISEVKSITIRIPDISTIEDFKIFRDGTVWELLEFIKKLEKIKDEIEATDIEVDERSMRINIFDSMCDFVPEPDEETVEVKLYESTELIVKEKIKEIREIINQ